MDKKEIYDACLEKWGTRAQCIMAIEEASELIKAITHRLRGCNKKEAVIEEIADMTLMCEQLAWIFGERQVLDQINLKLLRLEDRLNEPT